MRYLAAWKTLFSKNTIIILPSDKGVVVVVVMDSSIYNQKLMDLLDDNNTHEQISPQTILKYVNDFY